MLSATAPDLEALERAGRADLLTGEAQLQQYAAGAVQRREVGGDRRLVPRGPDAGADSAAGRCRIGGGANAQSAIN